MVKGKFVVKRILVWVAIAIAAVVVALVVIAYYGPAQHVQNSSQAASQDDTCIFGATGHDVEVQFTDDSTPCATQEAALASDGLSWYPISQLATVGSNGSADGETMGIACVLHGTNGVSVMTVMDAGGMFYGTQICSTDEQAGNWTNT